MFKDLFLAQARFFLNDHVMDFHTHVLIILTHVMFFLTCISALVEPIKTLQKGIAEADVYPGNRRIDV